MALFLLKRLLKQLIFFSFCISSLLCSSFSLANDLGNLPFNSTLNILKDAISGPFLLAVSVIMIVVTCLMLAFGEWGDGFKKIVNIVLWLSVAFGAASFVTTLFGPGSV